MRSLVRLLLAALMLGAAVLPATAQGSPSAPEPDAGPPASTSEPQRPTPKAPLTAGSIAGGVVDPNGTVVPGATVRLSGPNLATGHTAVADQWGRFIFSNLPVGSFTITVTAPNLTTFTSDPIALAVGQNLQLPQIVLRLGKTHADVQVVATLQDVAQAQVKAQEQQRVLGVLPNFYSSYIWNAAPMTPKQKLGLALRDTIDPVTFAVSAGIAGAEQWHNTLPGYGTGVEGYFKRFGASYADYTIATFISDAALPALWKQDPRYFYRGSGSTKSRAWYAVSRAFVCRGDDGRTEVNWSHLVGTFASAGIANVYHAPEDRSASLTIRNGFVILAGSAATNLIREFVLRKFVSKVPDYAQGKP